MESRKVGYYNWWLLPSWFEKEDYTFNLLNARQETVFEKPSFKYLIMQKRCVIPPSHYYEYQWMDAKGKNKHRIGVKGKSGFFMAGIYDHWKDPETGVLINSFSIITTDANELCAEIHNSKKRMPVILEEDKTRDWLNPNADANMVKSLLVKIESDKIWAENLDSSADLFG